MNVALPIEQIPGILLYALSLTTHVQYILVFLGAIVEGPILMVACGFFVRFGVFSPLPIYIVLVIGDLIADIAWYYVGYYFAEPLMAKHGKFLGVKPEAFEHMKKLLNEHQTNILLWSKITVGFGLALATVIAAGASKVPIRKYIGINAIGEMILVAILMALGFFFGHIYNYIADSFKAVFAIAGIVALLAAAYGFTKYIKSRTLKS